MAGFVKLEQMEVWKRWCGLAVQVYKATKEGELERDWGLRDQIRRAAVAIPSNIAEGYERGTGPEFRRFMQIAKGSCGELRTQIYLAQALDYISKSTASGLTKECLEISQMLQGLIRQLPKPSKH